MSSRLLGPPAARPPKPTTTTATTTSSSTDPFLNLMDSAFNTIHVTNPKPPMGLTENNSATYLSSGNPCLDFFFKVVPDTPSSTATTLLSSAWQHDPLTALKLVCNLRGVRGTGKSDRESFYSAALWIHNHHPKTLALNVASLAEFGYMKDLLEILYRLMHGEEVRAIAKRERSQKMRRVTVRRIGKKKFYTKAKRNRGGKKLKRGNRESRVAAEAARVKSEKEKAAIARRSKRAEFAKKAVERYRRDPEYRFLHERISDYFAEKLAADLENSRSGNFRKVSLAAKWCPSLDRSFDRTTLLCESIARKIFPKESSPEYAQLKDEHYAYRVRDRLRREVLVPLRKVLERPEVYMSAGKWDTLPYSRVASVAMKNYAKIFKQHDEARFSEYLAKVKEGTAKIAAGALLPHEILARVSKQDTKEVAELQWQRMVSDMAKLGKLNNCIAVCDVSGSMRGTPMDVCVALGILISELSEEPWKGRVITFSQNPELHVVQGETMEEKMEFVKRMEWGGNTDFQKVFDRLLEVAVAGNLDKEKMIKRVFVFSDMEFDQASGNTNCGYGGYNPYYYPPYGRYGRRHEAPPQVNSWDTDYEVICRKFTEKGYGSCIPEIVFWNLRSSESVPVTGTQKGVALVSGFSKNMVKLFLEEGEKALSPEAVMEDAITGAEYKKLMVFD